MHGFALAEASGSGVTVTEHQELSARKRLDISWQTSASWGASALKKVSNTSLRRSNPSLLRAANVSFDASLALALRLAPTYDNTNYGNQSSTDCHYVSDFAGAFRQMILAIFASLNWGPTAALIATSPGCHELPSPFVSSPDVSSISNDLTVPFSTCLPACITSSVVDTSVLSLSGSALG